MSDNNAPMNGGAWQSVPIEIRVCVGRARPCLGDMMEMTPDSVLPLDSRVQDPVSLYVGDKLIAEADLVALEGEQEGQLAVRITRLANDGHAPG
ncbi:MAG: FliM/FliN family flagellar motor C-terminal domain-containing protein [Pseudomonadota bacterium]